MAAWNKSSSGNVTVYIDIFYFKGKIIMGGLKENQNDYLLSTPHA